jgi:Flp pilus assembly pilin Flp
LDHKAGEPYLGITRPNQQKEFNLIMNILKNFLRDDQGQDLIEYTLLLAFVALASAALFISAGASVNTIWTVANSNLNNAAVAANS